MDSIKSTQRKTNAQWYVDGIVEIVGGCGAAVIGVLLLLSDSNPTLFIAIAIALTLLGGALNVPVMRMIKERITFPRTGSVLPKSDPGWQRMLWGVYSVAMFAVVLFIAKDSGIPAYYTVVVCAATGAILFAWTAWMTKAMRIYAIAFAWAISGVWAFIAQPTALVGLGGVLLAWGLTSLVTGAFGLRTFIHENPVLEEAE